jgi:hypothetical protein
MKRNIKWMITVLCVALAVGVGLYFLLRPEETHQLSEEKRVEISEAWQRHSGQELLWYHEADPHAASRGMRYYGSGNGYDILFMPSDMQAVMDVQIAGKLFSDNVFDLYAYKDGQFYDLKETYQAGLISEKTVHKAAQLHQNWNQ